MHMCCITMLFDLRVHWSQARKHLQRWGRPDRMQSTATGLQLGSCGGLRTLQSLGSSWDRCMWFTGARYIVISNLIRSICIIVWHAQILRPWKTPSLIGWMAQLWRPVDGKHLLHPCHRAFHTQHAGCPGLADQRPDSGKIQVKGDCQHDMRPETLGPGGVSHSDQIAPRLWQGGLGLGKVWRVLSEYIYNIFNATVHIAVCVQCMHASCIMHACVCTTRVCTGQVWQRILVIELLGRSFGVPHDLIYRTCWSCQVQCVYNTLKHLPCFE